MNEELYMTFENYLNNEMSAEEKKSFENLIQTDALINGKFQIYKDTYQFLETKFSSETIDFKKNLKTISKQNFAKKKKETKVITFKPIYYAVAASVALFFGLLFFMQNGNPQYSDYNQHETATFTERGSVIKNLKLAQEAFNSKNYKEAIINFEIVLKDYKRPEIEYFYGISLLEEDRYQDCETVFNKLKLGTSVYKDKALWYLALSNMKQNKLGECKTYLKQISEDSEDFEKAQELLKKLD